MSNIKSSLIVDTDGKKFMDKVRKTAEEYIKQGYEVDIRYSIAKNATAEHSCIIYARKDN